MKATSIVIIILSVLLCLAVPAFAGKLLARGMTNVAIGGSVTSSSAAGVPGQKYSAEMLSDGNDGTWWASSLNAPLPQWFQVTLPRPARVDTVALQSAENPTLYATWKHVVVELSDGQRTDEEVKPGTGPYIFRFDAAEIEWFKVTITEVVDAKGYVVCSEAGAYLDPDRRIREEVSPKERWRTIDLTEQGREAHPCVFLTPEDVEATRERMKNEKWAADYAATIIADADAALERSDEWILEMMPERGAAFAYGFTGCPECGASWGTWAGANCTWDNPGHVKCRNGHVLPNEKYPDEGTGYVGPDGRIHYFVGSWNSWVTEHLIFDFAGQLARAYSLTGEEKYAEKCAFILDAIANIYPECDGGSWDYPSDPPSGRLARPWYQVARVLVHLVDFYDQIFNSASLDASSLRDGMTRRENIVESMLKDGASYCYEQSLKGGLNNGEADYIRGALSVGCLLGIDSYVDWAYDGPYGILALAENCADRDGRYFETSIGYALHARDLYLTFTEPLYNYRSAKYPNGVDLHDNAKLLSFYRLPDLAIDCLGHSPRYGDSSPDKYQKFLPAHPFSSIDHKFVERMYTRCKGKQKEEFGAILAWLTQGDAEQYRAKSGDRLWLLFHAGEPPTETAELSEQLRQRLQGTTYFGNKGMALLRSLSGPDSQAALVRFGPSLNHGHFDDLNLNYYALGYELTFDQGYSLGSTHTQVGWARQTASHNLVLVNEKTQGADAAVDGSGGSLKLLGTMPGAQVSDCTAENTYKSQGVETYRRMTALIGQGRETYLWDVFTVAGGQQHDYIMHCPTRDFSVDGAELSPEAEGSLAGPDIKWGALQLNDGDMKGYPGKPYWNPPPGNGLGFLMNPRRGESAEKVAATWNISQTDSHLRMTLFPGDDTELITAWAPGIYPMVQGAYGQVGGLPESEYVFARRNGAEGLESTFAAIYEPYARPAVIGLREHLELARSATVSGGEMRHLPDVGVLLFKANSADDVMNFTLDVAEAGEYEIGICHYMSPDYGTAQLLIDGEAVGEEFTGTAPDVSPADPVSLGTRKLAAGEHKFSLRVTAPDEEGNYWMGLQGVMLTPAGMQAEIPTAEPFLGEIERLDTPDGMAAMRVEHLSGVVDHLAWSATPGTEFAAGDIDTDAGFAMLSVDGENVLAMNMLGGARLESDGLTVTMPQQQYEGSLSRVDYGQNRLYTTAKLPTDGRLVGAQIYIDNPGYSRNTVYTIRGIIEENGQTVIELGETSLVLGFADLDDEALDETTLTTLSPHEYSRALNRPDSGFFHGKLLGTADLTRSTNVRSTYFAQPFRIEVDSTQGSMRVTGCITMMCSRAIRSQFTVSARWPQQMAACVWKPMAM